MSTTLAELDIVFIWFTIGDESYSTHLFGNDTEDSSELITKQIQFKCTTYSLDYSRVTNVIVER